MKVIAVMSPKGGIGKTTTADSIAYILGEEQEKRVLVIDGDPQGDTSRTFGCYEPDGRGLSEILEDHASFGGDYWTAELIQETEYPHIDVIPANGYLVQTDVNLTAHLVEKPYLRLKDALKEVSGDYDYCICDCGRLFDMVVANILFTSKLIIVPVKVGGFENEAVKNLRGQVEELKKLNPALKLKGILTMRQKNKTSLEFEKWMRTQSGLEMFETPVRRSIIAEKATIKMQPLPAFSKRGIVTQDYRSIVEELVDKTEV